MQRRYWSIMGGSIAINPKFDKLITSLRTAVENGEGLLDKEATSYDDLQRLPSLDSRIIFIPFFGRNVSNGLSTTGCSGKRSIFQCLNIITNSKIPSTQASGSPIHILDPPPNGKNANLCKLDFIS
jgi:hypothetical protein